jgi:prephenate dehydrogenase
MNDDPIQIGVIGGTRGMGKWFSDFLRGEGYTVHASGRTSGMGFPEMTRVCGVVVISVPIGVTGDVIARIGPMMKEEALLMDLTSVKREPVRLMLESSISEVVGCHPLFGPQVPSLKGANVVLCPGRGERWFSWLKGIFEKNGARILETTPEKHDAMMAVVQGLNHLNTVALGMALAKTGVSLSDAGSFATPIFDAKIEIMRKVFSDNPRLYAEIMTMNPAASGMFRLYEEAVSELKEMILSGDADGLTGMMERYAALLWPPS